VVRVVPAVGGQVESDRQTFLTSSQIAAIKSIGGFGRTKTGILANSPRSID
jgi:hypothetical protein